MLNCGFSDTDHLFWAMIIKINVSTIARKFLWIICFFIFIPTLWVVFKIKIYIIEWSVLSLNRLMLRFPVILDPVGMVFSTVVLFISANVMQFAVTYITGEEHLKRFVYLVLLFVLSMNLLIFIPHTITLLLGWDGLGLVSFLLVIFYQNPKSLAAGIITALTNRIGDVIILLSIALMLRQGHWLILNIWQDEYSKLIIILLMLAAMTKSAQIPFSRWLPAAMAAPTPVSALVHSSTLVTAGVFLLIRFYPFLRSYGLFNIILLCSATVTIIMAGFNAIAECDLKKIIALSTLSQLGVIIRSTAFGLPMLTFFHLITHALFKALLFLCAGTLIHLFHHSQDLRTVGNLSNQMPLTVSTLLAANLALCGFPFIAGFYSKDLIIEISLFNKSNVFIIIMFFIATILTAAYSIRLTITALSGCRISLPIQCVNDEDTNVTYPILFLGVGAISGGRVINWILLAPLEEPFLFWGIKWSPFLLTVGGGLFSYTVVISLYSFGIKIHKAYSANGYIWFLAPLSTQFILKPSIWVSHTLLKSGDHGWLELLGPQGLNKVGSRFSLNLQGVQKLSVSSHLTLILLIIMFFNSYWNSLN